MIDAQAVTQLLTAAGLQSWAATIDAQLQARYFARPHGDSPRWQQAVERIPMLGRGSVCDRGGAVAFVPEHTPVPATTAALRGALEDLRPWRKGPYRFGALLVDSEWRSDWKWARVAPHIEPLRERRVLDVGCGNGYHCWRAALAGARAVIGIDPTALYVAQFAAVGRILRGADPALVRRVQVLPLGIEDLPQGLGAFDTVFSMGVLYHRRSPIDHLLELRAAMRPGGQLVLETLVVDGAADRVLVPAGRYAKMRNVWFIPSVGMLENWLRRCGFRSVTTVDVTSTTTAEQRATAWMTFESLADFLDLRDPDRTVEGYPAPRRAVCLASA